MPKETKTKSPPRACKSPTKKRSKGPTRLVRTFTTGSRASKSPPPEPTTHKMLETLLNWHPKTLVEKEDGGHRTRPPAFFDMHLDDELILKNLVFLPRMEDSIKHKVDGYLRSAVGEEVKLPPNAGFPDRSRVRWMERDISSSVLAEADVQSLYMRTTATFLCRVASTLAMKTPDWGNHFFYWEGTQTGNRKSAVGDGFFKIKADVDIELPSATLKSLHDIQEWFPNTAIWEFKNLTAGAEHHLRDIVRLSQETSRFPWVRCSGGRCPKHFDKHTRQVSVQGARMGFDALEPVISLSSDTEAYDVETDSHADDELDRGVRDHTIHLLQQVWAEAVRQDVTWMILQCGNFEMILYRCRVTSTFFISDIIIVDQRGYGRTQVGLYLAIYEDAISRASQLAKAYLTNTVPHSWLRTYKSQITKEAGVSPDERGPEPKFLSPQEVVEKYARSYNLAQFNYKKGGYLAGNRPDEFQRLTFGKREPSGLGDGGFVDFKDWADLGERRVLFVDVIESISPLVFDAKLHTATTKWDQDLVVKYAHNDGDYAKLMTEFSVYRGLREEERFKKFMPDLIGCFTLEETSELRHIALMMKKCGTSLNKHEGEIEIKDRISCIRSLKALHSAGYIHGSLDKRKILRDVDSSIKLIGFSNTVPCRDTTAIEAERQELLAIINDHTDNVKKLERERGIVVLRNAANCSFLLGPIVSIGYHDLQFSVSSLTKWVNDYFSSVKVTNMEGDFLYFNGVTKPNAEIFCSAWGSTRPFGFDLSVVNLFHD